MSHHRVAEWRIVSASSSTTSSKNLENSRVIDRLLAGGTILRGRPVSTVTQSPFPLPLPVAFALCPLPFVFVFVFVFAFAFASVFAFVICLCL